MGVTWHKVWRDLARNKGRTLLVVLSIAVGVFALGTVFGAYEVMCERMREDYRATNPAPVNIWAPPDQEVRDIVMREPGVADVESLAFASIRWKLPGEADWRDGELSARTDYEAQRIGLIYLLDGAWPAGRVLAVERQSALSFDIPVGSTVIIEYGQREVRLPVVGMVRDPAATPPRFGGPALFYTTPETVFWLSRDYWGRMDVMVTSHSQEGARELARRIWDRLRDMEVPVSGWGYRDPGKHWAQDVVDTVFAILMVLGGLSLAMGAFLIVNTMNAIVAQQVWQIGVMKAVGATAGRLVRLYLTMALIYGGVALLLAVPSSVVVAHGLAEWVLGQLNIAIGPLRIVPSVVGLQVAVGLALPLLVALVPVLGGAHISAHRAISTYGLGIGFGQGWLDRLVGRVRRLPRVAALVLRNTFRRKGRVLMTLVTLALGGMVFMMVLSVEASFDATVDMLVQDMGYDVAIYFEKAQLLQRLVDVGQAVPGVTKVEPWLGHFGLMLKFQEGDEVGSHIGLWGIPPDSTILNPRIVSGRALRPGDDHAILLNHKIAVEEGIQVGDEVRFSLGGEEMSWTVVGIILNLGYSQRECFVPYDALAREVGYAKRGWEVMVQSDQHDTESQRALTDALRKTYAAHHMAVSFSETASEVAQTSRAPFEIVVSLLLAMAFLSAAVGSIGLMGTTSINVVERRREIGVMRAVGASSAAVIGVFVAEGVLVGVLSWFLALPLSYPSAIAFGQVVGQSMLSTDLYFTYSVSGALLWLAIVVVLSALASLWPAWRAARSSVREALAYE